MRGKAREAYEQAIALDPNYAAAQAACCDRLYASDRARVTVNELGWLRLLRRTLG